MSSHICGISSGDKEILQQAISHWRPQTKNYEDSWGYIIQASRHMGGRWYDSTSKSLVFFGRKPFEYNTLVIPSFFAEPKHLKKIIEELHTTFNVSKTVLKNINPQDIEKFTPYGFRQYYDNEQWDDFARFDDQTYPQLLVDLQNTITHTGRSFRQLRRFLRKNYYAQIRQYNDKDKNAVLAILNAKDRITQKYLSAHAKGVYYQSHAMYPSADLDKFVIVGNNLVLGFIAFSAITSETVASVASLFKPDTGTLSIWGAYQSLLMIYQKGFKYINLGGCETEGVDRFHREKFRPVKEFTKTHLVYEC